MDFVFYRLDDGRVVQRGRSSTNTPQTPLPGCDVLYATPPAGDCYVQHGQIVAVQPRPGPFYDWNWSSKTWVANLPAAKTARKEEVNREVVRRTLMSINVAAAEFDADEVARLRISGMLARLLRGDGLPAGWMGWRGADNAMHWAEATADEVIVELSAVSRAIEDREQALLAAAWTHKAHIDALNRVEDVVAYSLTTGW